MDLQSAGLIDSIRLIDALAFLLLGWREIDESSVIRRSRAKLLPPPLSCFRSIHLQKAGTMLSAATAARSVAKKVRWMMSTLSGVQCAS